MAQITRRIKTPTTASGLCSCKFDMEDDYGKYKGHKPHTNWSIYRQTHSNPGFEYYIQCNGCNYQFARQYWNYDNSINGNKCDHLTEAEGK